MTELKVHLLFVAAASSTIILQFIEQYRTHSLTDCKQVSRAFCIRFYTLYYLLISKLTGKNGFSIFDFSLQINFIFICGKLELKEIIILIDFTRK